MDCIVVRVAGKGTKREPRTPPHPHPPQCHLAAAAHAWSCHIHIWSCLLPPFPGLLEEGIAHIPNQREGDD